MTELNEQNKILDLPLFTGTKELLIVGTGELVVERSLNQGEFHPLTDSLGNIVSVFTGSDILYNAQLASAGRGAQYRVRVVTGSAKIEVL